VETVREGGFTIEGGPDAWVSAKPWARELAVELGLESELMGSNDATRKTHIFLATEENPGGALVAMPAGFHMMVPTDLDALAESAMFTAAAVAAYRAEPARAAELLAATPERDESVAEFTRRHFGPEVLARVAAPLLSGVFGGDVHRLSVRAVMPTFVAMEREHGSLITALHRAASKQQQAASKQQTTNGERGAAPIFTTLRGGLGTLVDRMVAAIPQHWLRLNTAVLSIEDVRVMKNGSLPAAHDVDRTPQLSRWIVSTRSGGHHGTEAFDEVFVATPLDVTRRLIAPLDGAAAALLPAESSSAVLVAFAYADAARVPLPQGFGFLVPPALSDKNIRTELSALSASDSPEAMGSRTGELSSPSSSLLLACTFVDQKFNHRVPAGGRLVRAFFGGAAAERIARCGNDEVAAIARLELARILNADAAAKGAAAVPAPMPSLTVVRRWPNSLPQYAVGHVERVAELEARLRERAQGVVILGNALHGVGIPDLVRDARAAVREVVGG
jgi:oxygen-dependent protoporphyrinogen oxidase